MSDYISQFTGSEIDQRLAKVPQLETGKQDKLESGENIKTVGGQSILGPGNIPVGDENAVKFTPQTLTDAQKAQALANIGAASLEDVANMDFVIVTSLPSASASTMGHIYLVGPDANDNYDRYVTKLDGGSYSWVTLGSTQIDLSDYATKAEVDELEAKVTDLELPSGSYTQAQARVYNHPEEWCFLLNQPGTGIRKPIWHIGNGVFIDATGAVISFEVITPATPTFSPDGGSVPEGTVVALACATPDADIYVSTDDGETYTKTSTVTISEAVTLMAYSELEGIRSAVVSKAFTIAVDHRFKFTVKLDQDNATVYVPVAAGTYYTMEVDWGDGSTPDSYSSSMIGLKGCSHTYSGLAGDTFQITLRGTNIPKLNFGYAQGFTTAQLKSIDDNTLDIATSFADANGKLSLSGCSNLVSLSDNAFSNQAGTVSGLKFQNCSKLTTLGVGFLSIFENNSLVSIDSLFDGCSALSLTQEFMSVLANKIGAVTSFFYLFYGCKGSIPIPDNFFDNLTADTVTDLRQMTGGTATGVTGDAKALYDVLATKVTSSASTTSCFSGTNLSNRNQVPTAWGGTM